MIRQASKLALAAAAALCLPAAAQAGTSTAGSTASFNVVNQCSISGATVDLGTYTTQQTWGDLAASIGHLDVGGGVYTAGSRGNWLTKLGTITCENNLFYAFTIHGSSNDPQASKAVELTVGGKTARLQLYVTKVGGDFAVDDNIPGRGIGVGADPIPWIGYGEPQDIEGSAVLLTTATTTAQLTDKFAATGTYADTLTYTLTF